MNTASHSPCQTSGRPFLARSCVVFWLAATFCSVWPVGPVFPGEPPAWQRELDSVRLGEATVALLPPGQRVEAGRRLDELCRRLAARYPAEPAVRKAVGNHFWQTGDTDRAVAEWQAAQTLDPADAETASALGSAHLRDGQVRQAREQFQRAVDARPDVASYHFDLANVLYAFRHELTGSPALPDETAILHAALAHFRQASDLAAGDAAFAQAYAETFYLVSDADWSQALAAWERVRTLNAAASDFANSHLARVSLRLGKPEQAEGYLALIRSPGFDSSKGVMLRQAQAMKAQAYPPR